MIALLLQMTDRGQRYQKSERSERQRSRDRLTNKQPSNSPFKQGSSRHQHQNSKNTNQSQSHHQQVYYSANKNIQNLAQLNKVIQNMPIPIKSNQVQFLSSYFQRFNLTNDFKHIFKTFFKMFVKAAPQQAIYKSFYNLLRSGKPHIQQVLKKYTAIIKCIIQILCQKFQDKYIEHVKNNKSWEQFLLVSAYNETINFKSFILLIKKVIEKQMSLASEILKNYYEILLQLIKQNLFQIPLNSNSAQKQPSQKSKILIKKPFILLPMVIRQVQIALVKRFKSQINAEIIKYVEEVQKFQNQMVSVQNKDSSLQSKQKSSQLRNNLIVFLITFQFRISPQFYGKLLSKHFIKNILNKRIQKKHSSVQKQQFFQQSNNQQNQLINTQYSLGVLSRIFVNDCLNFQENNFFFGKKYNEIKERRSESKDKKQKEEPKKINTEQEKENINTDIFSQIINASLNTSLNMYHKLMFTLLIQKEKNHQKDKQQKQKQRQPMLIQQDLQELPNKQVQQKLAYNPQLNFIHNFIFLSPFRISLQEIQFQENYMKIRNKMMQTKSSYLQNQYKQQQNEFEISLIQEEQITEFKQSLPIIQKIFSHLLSTQIQVLFQINNKLFNKIEKLLGTFNQQSIQQNQLNIASSDNKNYNECYYELDNFEGLFVQNLQNTQNNKQNTTQNNLKFQEVKNQLKIILKNINQNTLKNASEQIRSILQSCFKFIIFNYLLIKNQAIQNLIKKIKKSLKQSIQNLSNFKETKKNLSVPNSSQQRFQKVQKQKSQQRQKQRQKIVTSSSFNQLNKTPKKQIGIQVQQKQRGMKNFQKQQQKNIKELKEKFKKQTIRRLQNDLYQLLKILCEEVLSTFTFNGEISNQSTNKSRSKKIVVNSMKELVRKLTHDINLYAKKYQNNSQSQCDKNQGNQQSNKSTTNNQKQQQIKLLSKKYIIEAYQGFCQKQCEALAWFSKKISRSFFDSEQLQKKINKEHLHNAQSSQFYSLKSLLFPNKKNTIFQKLSQITKLQLKLQQISYQNQTKIQNNFNKKPSSIYQEVILKKKMQIYEKQLLAQISTSILQNTHKNGYDIDNICVYQKEEEILYQLFRFSINNQENYQKIVSNLSADADSKTNQSQNNSMIYSTMIKVLDFGKNSKKQSKQLSFQTIPKCQKVSSQILTFLTGTLKNTELLNLKIRKLIFMFYDKVNQHTINTFIVNRKLFILQAMIASNYKMKTLAQVLLKEQIKSNQLKILFLNNSSGFDLENDDNQKMSFDKMDTQNLQNQKEKDQELDIVKLFLKFLINKDEPALKYQLIQKSKLKNNNISAVYKDLYQKINQIEIQ